MDDVGLPTCRGDNPIMEPLDYSGHDRNPDTLPAPSVGLLLTALLTPPGVVWFGWLAARLAISRSYWGAIPLFLFVLGGAALASLLLAGWFAAHANGWTRLWRFLGWVACFTGLVAIGLAIIDSLPIAVGDGP